MSAFAGAAARAGRAGRGLVPTGRLLTPEVWVRRHRGTVWLLWLHVAGVAVFALTRGKSQAHTVAEATPMVVFALAAALPALGRRARSAAAVLGLITASAVIVHLSGGVVEAHFHFFVMVGVITLYQDWLPFGISRLVSRLEGLARTDPLTGVPTGGSGRRSCPGSWSGPGAWAPGCAWP